MDEQAEERGGDIVAFRAAPELITSIVIVAQAYGIPDVARRAVLRDLIDIAASAQAA